MVTIYLAGPVSEGPNPYDWHEKIQSVASEIDWINPFTIHEYDDDELRDNTDDIIQRDLTAIRDADAVLLRRIDEYNLCGASMEAREAYTHDVPVVVWNDAETQIPLFLEGHADVVVGDMTSAIEEAKFAVSGSQSN